MSKIQADKNYNSSVYYSDGEVVKIYASKLKNTMLHAFKGWTCEAGYSTLYVHANGDVWSGECENEFLGNLNNETFKLLEKPGTCNKNFCSGNGAEISTKKFKTT